MRRAGEPARAHALLSICVVLAVAVAVLPGAVRTEAAYVDSLKQCVPWSTANGLEPVAIGAGCIRLPMPASVPRHSCVVQHFTGSPKLLSYHLVGGDVRLFLSNGDMALKLRARLNDRPDGAYQFGDADGLKVLVVERTEDAVDMSGLEGWVDLCGAAELSWNTPVSVTVPENSWAYFHIHARQDTAADVAAAVL